MNQVIKNLVDAANSALFNMTMDRWNWTTASTNHKTAYKNLRDATRAVEQAERPEVESIPLTPRGHSDAHPGLQRHSVGELYPWIIVGTGIEGNWRYAYNGETGARHPARTTYERAVADIGKPTTLTGPRKQDDDGVPLSDNVDSDRLNRIDAGIAESSWRAPLKVIDRDDALRFVQPTPKNVIPGYAVETPGSGNHERRNTFSDYHQVPSPSGARYTGPRVGASYTLTLADAIELGRTIVEGTFFPALAPQPARIDRVLWLAVFGAGHLTVKGVLSLDYKEKRVYAQEVLAKFPKEQRDIAVQWTRRGLDSAAVVAGLRLRFGA